MKTPCLAGAVGAGLAYTWRVKRLAERLGKRFCIGAFDKLDKLRLAAPARLQRMNALTGMHRRSKTQYQQPPIE